VKGLMECVDNRVNYYCEVEFEFASCGIRVEFSQKNFSSALRIYSEAVDFLQQVKSNDTVHEFTEFPFLAKIWGI
jgi:transcription elongation factor Elf1